MATKRSTANISTNPELDVLVQLKAKLERGSKEGERGELIDGDDVFEELRQMIEERRTAKACNA